MLPEPLHPAVVHFPMALAALLPLFALGALWAICRGARPLHAWAVPLTLAVLLTGSAWAALETGEAEEERVEALVGEQPLHAHEEAGERFLVLSGVLMLLSAAGLAGGTVGGAARLLSTAASVVVLVAGIQVGSAGGDLVYVHRAAQAYVDGGAPVAGRAAHSGEESPSEREDL